MSTVTNSYLEQLMGKKNYLETEALTSNSDSKYQIYKEKIDNSPLQEINSKTTAATTEYFEENKTEALFDQKVNQLETFDQPLSNLKIRAPLRKPLPTPTHPPRSKAIPASGLRRTNQNTFLDPNYDPQLRVIDPVMKGRKLIPEGRENLFVRLDNDEVPVRPMHLLNLS